MTIFWKLARIHEVICPNFFPTATVIALFLSAFCAAADRINILDYAQPGTRVDRTGMADVSTALANAVNSANSFTRIGQPACIYFPPGIYRIISAAPPFERAGCVLGDGPSQSVIKLDKDFEGDLFSWSEAWVQTTPGPMIVGIRIIGSKAATKSQNALVFYDRNDLVFIDNVEVTDVHGHALYSGVTKSQPVACMRESQIRSLRLSGDGAPGIPALELNSQGSGRVDGTNAIRMSLIDIYGARGPSFVIRNNGGGGVRGITIEGLRIEGSEDGSSAGDLLVIGDSKMYGNVNNITLTDVDLIDPSQGFAALRVTAPIGAAAPYQISFQGSIGGGIPKGEGLRIDAGRQSSFRFTGIHTFDTNVVIGPRVSWIILDGNGQETSWTYKIDASSANAIHVPVRRAGNPATWGIE